MKQQTAFNEVGNHSAEPVAVGARRHWPRNAWLTAIGVTAFACGAVYAAAVQPPQGPSSALRGNEPAAAASTPSEPTPVPPEPAPSPLRLNYVPPATAEGLQKEALAVANQLMMELPNHTDPIGLMGMVYYRLDDAASALKCWEECLRRNPKRVDVYQAMIQLALDQGDYERAEILSRKALELNPQLPGTDNLLAQALMGLGKPKDAVAVLTEHLGQLPQRSQDPWLDQDYFLAGKAYQQLGEFAQAKQCYQKAIEIHPDYVQAFYGLAMVCARLGEKDEAKQHLAEFKTLKAQGHAAHMERRARGSDEGWLRRVLAQTHTDAGRIYAGHRKFRKAEEHWQKAVILDPDNLVCRRELATFYAKSGRNQEALELCKQLVKLDPKNALCHFNMGVLYARMDQIGLALAALSRAVELEPANPLYQSVYRRIREMK